METPKSTALMIIDDDSDDRTIFKESVTKVDPGLICLQASNGADGLQKLLEASFLPEYVFVDVNMPVMSGFDVLSRIRSHEKLKDLKVIIYTTSSQKSAIQTAKTLGADGFFTKPEETGTLVKYISDLLRSPATKPFVEVGLLAILGTAITFFH